MEIVFVSMYYQLYIYVYSCSSLTSNFSVQFSEPFSIRIVQWPENIKLRVRRKQLLVFSMLLYPCP